MFVLRAAIICLTFMCISQSLALNSLHNYGDNAYPNRCVIDMGTTVVLLNMGESVKLQSLPCTMVLCIGDGYGMIQTCENNPPIGGCRYGKYINWDAEYPKCCQRPLICA